MIYLNILSLISLLTSLFLFFFGYVPKTTYTRNSSRGKDYFKERTIDKVVLVIIDSLRPDMVYNKKDLWVSLNRNINKSWAYSTIAELQPPSMSLPKIKCIVTGSVVNFIDVIFNTDAGKITQENLIDILKEYRNFKINLYGDETWTKLFPYQFNYIFSSSPFFVRDFYDVDKKISANIPTILANINNWDFIIMHYLGLDHIGHSFGPFSSYVDGKLLEMDANIGVLINGFFEKNNNDRNLLILTADHGMSDLGGHGGSSSGELQVPLIFISKKFQRNPDILIENILQNDIAPSLALLLGVPIPPDSIGVIPYRLLYLIEGFSNRTEALNSNYIQLSKLVKNLPKSIEERFSNVNSTIFRIQQNCIINSSELCLKDLETHHKILINIMNDIKDICKPKFIQHSFIMLEYAFILSFFSLLLCSSICLLDLGYKITVPGFVFLFSIFLLLLSALILENLKICLFWAFKISIIFIMIILTGHSMAGTKGLIRFLKTLIIEGSISEIIVILTLIINLLGFSFSSVIKEEHQVWFYISSTLILLFFSKEIILKILMKKETIQMKSTYVCAIFILIADRILRTLNRTGERWTKVPNFGDWLNGSENSCILLAMIGFCLVIVGFQLWKNDTIFISLISQVLIILNGIHRFGDINKNRHLSDISVWLYYLFVFVHIGLSLILKPYFNKSTFRISNIIFFMSFLICRNQNVFLWTGIIIKRILFRKIWLEEIHRYNLGVQFIIFNILGMTSYYQQGNSNSLTTIDVLPGFVGMPSYIALIVDPIVAIHLFSGNLFWIITWLEWLAESQTENLCQLNSKDEEPENIIKNIDKTQSKLFSKVVLNLTMISSLFSVVLYLFSIIHKHDFSAWSVYAPKLLFHSFHNGIVLVVYISIARLKLI